MVEGLIVELEYSRDKPASGHFVHHKSQMDWSRLAPNPLQWGAGIWLPETWHDPGSTIPCNKFLKTEFLHNSKHMVFDSIWHAITTVFQRDNMDC